MTILTETSVPFLDQADAWAAAETRVPAWWAGLRQAGRDRFAADGLPDERAEAWQFTSLKPLHKTAFRFDPAATGSSPGNGSLLPDAATRLIFVNGVLDSGRSTPRGDGARVATLAQVVEHAPGWIQGILGTVAGYEDSPFPALNTAFLSDGAVVHVMQDTDPDDPILIRHHVQGDAPAVFPRTVVVADAGTRVTVVEEHTGGAAPGFTCPVTEILVGPDASVEHILIQNGDPSLIHLGAVFARVDRAGRYRSRSLALGGRLSRTEISVELAGEGAETDLDGLYVIGGRQFVDHHTRVDHAQPHTLSRELYKGVLSGKSRAVFNGRVLVRPHAQKIESSQTNKNLLLSREALVNTNPELEIFADDVAARHGATIGQLEDEHMFYLRSRGIPFEDARRILIHGFVGEMIDRIGVESLREPLRTALEPRF